MYKESLKHQWENIVADFVVEHQKLATYQLNAGKIEEWYRLRIRRFSSLVQMEGMELDHLNKPEFAAELRRKLDDFSFHKKTPETKFSMTKALVINAVPAVATGVLTAMFANWPIIWPILLGVVLLLSGVALAFRQADEAQSKAAAGLLREYAGQLEEYLKQLLDICDKYGV